MGGKLVNLRVTFELKVVQTWNWLGGQRILRRFSQDMNKLCDNGVFGMYEWEFINVEF